MKEQTLKKKIVYADQAFTKEKYIYLPCGY